MLGSNSNPMYRAGGTHRAASWFMCCTGGAALALTTGAIGTGAVNLVVTATIRETTTPETMRRLASRANRERSSGCIPVTTSGEYRRLPEKARLKREAGSLAYYHYPPIQPAISISPSNVWITKVSSNC
jgi:hypothetical protein